MPVKLAFYTHPLQLWSYPNVRAVKILERVLATIPIVFGVAIIVFLFIRLTPGDPVDIMMGTGGAVSTGEMEQLRSEFHLDEPLLVQLWLFLKDAVRGDLGYSYILKRPVSHLIGSPIHVQQPGCVPARRRCLGDQVFGQLVIVVV